MPAVVMPAGEPIYRKLRFVLDFIESKPGAGDLNSEERAQSHNWSDNALISQAACITIATAISTHSRTSLCNEREVKEGILHAWRAYTTGCSSERAISRGVIHASSLTQSRLLKLKAP